MVSSGMLHRVALVRTDVSEELSASIIRVTRICEIGTTIAVTSNRRSVLHYISCLFSFMALCEVEPAWYLRPLFGQLKQLRMMDDENYGCLGIEECRKFSATGPDGR
jgi:hypothetical protein